MNAAAQNIRAALPDLGSTLKGQLDALHADATPDRCDYMIRGLSDVATICARLRTELLRGEKPTV